VWTNAPEVVLQTILLGKLFSFTMSEINIRRIIDLRNYGNLQIKLMYNLKRRSYFNDYINKNMCKYINIIIYTFEIYICDIKNKCSQW
jgi:hypothetical protein